MKKKLLGLVLVTGVLFTACQNDTTFDRDTQRKGDIAKLGILSPNNPDEIGSKEIIEDSVIYTPYFVAWENDTPIAHINQISGAAAWQSATAGVFYASQTPQPVYLQDAQYYHVSKWSSVMGYYAGSGIITTVDTNAEVALPAANMNGRQDVLASSNIVSGSQKNNFSSSTPSVQMEHLLTQFNFGICWDTTTSSLAAQGIDASRITKINMKEVSLPTSIRLRTTDVEKGPFTRTLELLLAGTVSSDFTAASLANPTMVGFPVMVSPFEVGDTEFLVDIEGEYKRNGSWTSFTFDDIQVAIQPTYTQKGYSHTIVFKLKPGSNSISLGEISSHVTAWINTPAVSIPVN